MATSGIRGERSDSGVDGQRDCGPATPQLLHKILLVGYGAIGVVYSYVIQKSRRARLTVVARSNYDVAKYGGIVINSVPFGKVTDFRPNRVLPSVGEAADRAYKYVFIATKALPDVLPTSNLY
ncbi:hypothetical protein FRB94_000061 [Tulasnella sp. JGI-2019a]|nr:hypothetical protein FRB94_000061 [Tulasnella sp. JGI-2019a]